MKRFVLTVVILAACGGDDDGGGGGADTDAGGDGQDGGGVDDAAPDVDAGAPDWQPLVGRSWTAPGFADVSRCRTFEAEEDLWLGGFRATLSTGAYSVLVTRIEETTQLGDYNCQPWILSSLDRLYMAGPGTDPFVFPEGVAMHVEAGQYVHLEIHAFNGSEDPIAGDVLVEAVMLPAASVTHEAELLLSGSTAIDIPASANDHPVSGECGAVDDWHAFGLVPKLHSRGVRVEVHHLPIGGGDDLLLDIAYSDADRDVHATDVAVSANDSFIPTCYYDNPTGETIYYGETYAAEQCYVGIYKYPPSAETNEACITAP